MTQTAIFQVPTLTSMQHLTTSNNRYFRQLSCPETQKLHRDPLIPSLTLLCSMRIFSLFPFCSSPAASKCQGSSSSFCKMVSLLMTTVFKKLSLQCFEWLLSPGYSNKVLCISYLSSTPCSLSQSVFSQWKERDMHR